MQVIELKPDFSFTTPTVLTVGVYDGVHLGHQALLRQVVEVARSQRLPAVLMSFEPHPRNVLAGHTVVHMLTPHQEKVELLRALGLDYWVVCPFDGAFAAQPMSAYVVNVLVGQLRVQTLLIGHDHQFGKDRSGGFSDLLAFGEERHFQVRQLEAQSIGGAVISSSKIRNCLLAGDIEKANDYLGRPYRLIGQVVHGNKRGRQLGYPTANLVLPADKLIPAGGVYTVRVRHQKNFYLGMMNIGTNPTFTREEEKKIEVHILDFSADLYGQTLEVDVLGYLREERKFASLEMLVQQLQEDESKIRHL